MGALKKSNFNRLRNKGYSGYREYLRSEHWARVRKAYRESGRPMTCIGCGAEPIELHHRSYSRVGDERLNDVIPLCRDCHQKVHEYIDLHPGQMVQGTHAILRRIHGWTKGQTKHRLKPFNTPDGLRRID